MDFIGLDAVENMTEEDIAELFDLNQEDDLSWWLYCPKGTIRGYWVEPGRTDYLYLAPYIQSHCADYQGQICKDYCWSNGYIFVRWHECTTGTRIEDTHVCR